MGKAPNKIKSESFNRTLALRFDASEVDTEKRVVPASLSSETVVKRWFGKEKLIHSDKAINLERAENGLPILFNHNRDQFIGRAYNVHLDDGKLRAELHFSGNPLAEQVFRDVQEEFLRDISIGYRIERYKEVKGGIEATRWTPHEITIATIGADPTVGINRTMEGEEMTTEGTNNQDGLVTDVNLSHRAAVEEGARLERERVASIEGAFALFDTDSRIIELKNRCINDGVSVEVARQQLLVALGDGFTPTATPTEQGQERSVDVVADEQDKFYDAALNAVMVRSGIETDPKQIEAARETDLMSLKLSGLAREFMTRQGVSLRGMTEMDLVGESFIRISGGHSTSHFAALMEDVANKAAAKGYDEMQTTWRRWAAVTSVTDFKKSNLVTLSEFTDLALKPEGGEYTHGTMKDKKEQIGVGTYGKIFSLTREAIINDDLNKLAESPRKMGVAAARSVESLVYGVLTSNPALMEDNTAVFHSNHNNMGTAGAPGETTIDEIMRLISLQKGLINDTSLPKNKQSSAILGLRGKYILVPVALELSTKQFLMAEYAQDALNKPNVLRNVLEVIASPHLDNVSTTAWYVLADQNITDTVSVAFLNGNQSPYIESKNGWSRDGIEYKVRIDVGAAWGDFRGAAYNAGA